MRHQFVKHRAYRLVLVSGPALIFVGLLFFALSLLTQPPSTPDTFQADTSVEIALIPDAPHAVSNQATSVSDAAAPQAPALPQLAPLDMELTIEVAPMFSLPEQPAAPALHDFLIEVPPTLRQSENSEGFASTDKPAPSVNLTPTVISRTPPSYPLGALRRRQQGFVIAEFTVSPDGTVSQASIEIVESSPPDIFDQAVLRSLSRWRFQPLSIDGVASEYRARQKVDFKLENG